MTKMKKLVSMALAMAMCASLMVPAFAATGDVEENTAGLTPDNPIELVKTREVDGWEYYTAEEDINFVATVKNENGIMPFSTIRGTATAGAKMEIFNGHYTGNMIVTLKIKCTTNNIKSAECDYIKTYGVIGTAEKSNLSSSNILAVPNIYINASFDNMYPDDPGQQHITCGPGTFVCGNGETGTFPMAYYTLQVVG